jgi:alkanesulfonate monooxygenase SsuD/methylene tetrahydromethanopterin reductase-like flavin-dependent oxidoreductase (luciferase family)
MLLGGSHPRSAERAARLTGHWFPNVRKLDHQRLERILVSTRAEHPELRCSVFAATPREDAIAALADLGVERCVIALPTAERDDCLRRIDRYAPLLRSFPEAAV